MEIVHPTSSQILSKEEKHTLVFLSGLGILAFLLNLGVNNIWTPNEGFYAEAVREIFESGNFINIQYNYEPRYQKPPMLYWLIAAFASVFGLNEWTVRLPSALLGLGAIYLTYRIGRLLAGPRLGAWAAIVMCFSFQFTINARYAAPTVPLTFFFTLTIYWFLVYYETGKKLFLLLSYVALGWTMFTKGYPYLIIVGAIIIFFILLDREDWRSFWKRIGALGLWWGIPLSIFVGLSWTIYMSFTQGDEFIEILMRETFDRAFRKKSSLKPFFYLEVNLWGFLPYSLTFYLALVFFFVRKMKDLALSKTLKLGFAWFLVMLVVFTIAKGKIPTYFIQGHPGMSLFTAWYIVHLKPSKVWLGHLWRFSWWFPALLFVVGGVGMVYIFEAFPAYYLLALSPLILLWLSRRYRSNQFLQMPVWPFAGFAIMYIIVSAIVMPNVESHRQQHLIGEALRQRYPDQGPTVLMAHKHMHNLPFYSHLPIAPYQSPEEIRRQAEQESVVALLPLKEKSEYLPKGKILWQGPYYTSSETRTLQFIIDVLKDRRGEKNRFETYVLVVTDEQ